MNTPDPTPEQASILTAFKAGGPVTIVAAAGSGKTTSLRMIAEAAGRGRRGLYVAYSKAVQTDAQARFPAACDCRTAHSLAYRAIGSRYRDRLNGPRVTASQSARVLRINEALKLDDKMIQPNHLARLALAAVQRFCYSADPDILPRHVPAVTGLEAIPQRDAIRQVIVPYARRAWEDLRTTDGQLKFNHDCYLKIWALSSPHLPFDYLLYDEAQDSNPVVLGIMQEQRDAQVVAVGDPNQAIFGWRGATDAMNAFGGARLLLSKSFRFGPAIADEANKWLDILDAEFRVTGYERVSSALRHLPDPDAILCRTNAKAIDQVMTRLGNGQRVALTGGAADLIRLAQAAISLKAGLGTDHPELFAFRTWAEVQDHAEHDESGADLKVFVKLIDDHGPDTIIDALGKLSDERRADVIISTAHRAKGREWDSVKVAGDFREPAQNNDGSPGRIPAEQAMLAYVTVTRARLALDRSGLAWVDGYLPGAGSSGLPAEPPLPASALTGVTP